MKMLTGPGQWLGDQSLATWPSRGRGARALSLRWLCPACSSLWITSLPEWPAGEFSPEPMGPDRKPSIEGFFFQSHLLSKTIEEPCKKCRVFNHCLF